MTFFKELQRRVGILLFGIPRARTEAPPPQQVAPETPRADNRPVRQSSSALNRAIEELRANPEISPAQLASKLSISASYARTLLRRARLQAEPATRALLPERRLQPVAIAPANSSTVEATMQEISSRLAETEKQLASLRSSPAHTRTSMSLNRRAEVLRLHSTGKAAGEIAESLSIPRGEVEFILKVDRILVS